MIVPFYEYGHNQLSASSGHQLHFPLHLHNCPEMILIRAGSMRAQIGDREYTLQAGDLAIILPNITHSYHTLTSPEETLLDLIICGHNPQSALPRQLSGRILTEPVKPIASYHPDVAYAFSALLSEAGNTDSAPIVSAYLQILWHRLLPSLDTADAMTPTTSNLAATLITYVTDRKGHDMRYAIDPAFIHEELGWLPETRFEEGIQKTIQWYLDNRAWWESIVSGEYQSYYERMYGNR